MSAGFDRSLLEGKDRDELIQIANALGEKPLSRAKKADIIALVLRAAGVDDSGAADLPPTPKPKRAPRSRANGKTTPKAETATPDTAAGQLPLAGGDKPADPPDGPSPAVVATEPAISAGDGSAAARPASDTGPAAPVQGGEAGRQDQARDRSQPQDGGRDRARDESVPGGASQRGNGPTQPDRDTNQSNRSRSHDQTDTNQPQAGSRQGQGSPGAENLAAQRNAGNQQNQGNQPSPNQGTPNQGNQGAQGNQPSPNQGSQQTQPNPNQANQQTQQTQQNPNQQTAGSQQGNGDSESANKRRRRRGRDRDRQGGPQGQGQGPDDVFIGEPVPVAGLLDLRDEGYGFLRLKGYLPSSDDVYVSVKQARQFNLRKGDQVTGTARPAARNEKNPALHTLETVNGVEADRAKPRPRFEDLTPLFPDEKLHLEIDGDSTNMTTRIIDLIAPIGKGQRGLIVSPPKAGKTTVMKHIARSIETNHPDVHLIVLLVDERPEEVTDMKRWLKRGEVAASTFDRPSEEHTHVSELVIERAKRMVEDGKDVVIILDGITRLARAYNLAQPPSGRIMSGGIDAAALYPPKKFFGAARNVEEGGSLTILATALVETNSRMDEHIFEEFKGTGNMELKLDRRLADRRIFPAIDVEASSTRREELLFDRRQLQNVWKLRRVLGGLSNDGGSSAAGLELLIDRIRTFKSNEAFLAEIGKAGTGM